MHLCQKSCFRNMVILSFLINFLRITKSQHQLGIVFLHWAGKIEFVYLETSSSDCFKLGEDLLHAFLLKHICILHPFIVIVYCEIGGHLQTLGVHTQVVVDILHLLPIYNWMSESLLLSAIIFINGFNNSHFF
jgi:hypothetical protein